MRQDTNGTPLPRGLMYDPVRLRYRVRLYRFHRVIWLSYSRSKEQALDDLERAKLKQAVIRQHSGTIRGVDALVDALQNDYV